MALIKTKLANKARGRQNICRMIKRQTGVSFGLLAECIRKCMDDGVRLWMELNIL